jgi:hypothetical protein
VNLSAVVGTQAFVGFSAGTGGLTNNHEVLNFFFNAGTQGAPNRPPVLVNPGDRIDAQGSIVSLALEATDPDGDSLAFGATGLPAGLAISPAGLITGTITATPTDYPVTVTVSDGRGGSNSATFTWTVTAASGGVTLDYPDFSQVTGWQLNGAAALADGVLRLTPATPNLAGTAFYGTPLEIGPDTSFSSRFDFRIHGTIDGADGMTFMIQGNTASSLGGTGSGLGYRGIPASLAVEIDTYAGSIDPDGNHLAVLTNGIVGNHRALHSPGFDLADGAVHTLWVDYDAVGQTLAVYLAQTPGSAKPSTPVMTSAVNLSAVVGTQAFVGFSAGTGGLTNNHEVRNLTFVSE